MNSQINQVSVPKEQIDFVIYLYSSGKIEEAIIEIKSLNENYPNVPLLFNILGACYKSIGETENALKMFETATKIKIDYSEAHFNVGVVRQELGRFDDAIESYKNVVAIKPDYFDAHNNLGIVYLEAKEFDNAINHFNLAINYKKDFAEAYNNLGTVFQEQGQIEKALKSYKKATSLDSNYAQAHNNMGILLQMLGKNDNAISSYENAIKSRQNFASAHLNLSLIKIFFDEDPQIFQMQSLLTSKETSRSEKAILCFALAKAYNDLENDKKFFEYLNEGNRLRKNELGFSYEESEVNYNLFIKSLFQDHLSNDEITSNESSDMELIFIVGMPRSGTSLVEQIISNHSKVHGGGELNYLSEILVPILQESLNKNADFINDEKYTYIRKEYMKKISLLNVKEKTITDKWPLNFRHIGFILSSFPKAKIVHLRRDPRAVCWSIYKHYFSDRANGWAYDLNDIARFYDAHTDLMSFWHEKYPNKIYDICYEDLTTNQLEETRKLLDYCNLEWDENCLNFHKNKRAVETASATQVRKKMFKGSSDVWKKYKDQLQPLISHFEEK
jgi:tetratricopeptide (TPR) repeat protein